MRARIRNRVITNVQAPTYVNPELVQRRVKDGGVGFSESMFIGEGDDVEVCIHQPPTVLVPSPVARARDVDNS